MSAESPPSTVFRQASLIYLVLTVGALLWIGLQGRTLDWLLIVGPSWPRDLAAGVGVAALLLGAWFLVRRSSEGAQRLEQVMARQIGPLAREEAYALAFFSACAEELLFRGAMLPAWGWLLTTVLFGLVHIGPGREFLGWTLSALIAGAALAGLTLLAEGALLAAMVAHFLVNAVQLPRIAALAVAEDPQNADDPSP